MGSHLTVRKDRVWIDLADLAVGGLSRLAADAPGVQPEGLVPSAYAGLIQYLSQSHEVVPFPYDWRCSIREGARRLAQAEANELHCTVYLRDPVSDAVIEVIEPKNRGR